MDHSGTNVIWTIVSGVLVAVVGGIAMKLCTHLNSSEYQDSASSKADVPARSTETQVRFAALITAKQLRETGNSPDMAERLFSSAFMRWAGSETEWANNIQRMGLSSLQKCPSVDTEDVILTFTASLPIREIPTNRLTMRSCLKRTSGEGKLIFSELYNCPQTVNPTRFGFQEG